MGISTAIGDWSLVAWTVTVTGSVHLVTCFLSLQFCFMFIDGLSLCGLHFTSFCLHSAGLFVGRQKYGKQKEEIVLKQERDQKTFDERMKEWDREAAERQSVAKDKAKVAADRMVSAGVGAGAGAGAAPSNAGSGSGTADGLKKE